MSLVNKELIMYKKPVESNKVRRSSVDSAVMMGASHTIPAEFDSPRGELVKKSDPSNQRGSESKDVEEAGNQAQKLIDAYVNSERATHQIPINHKAFATDEFLKSK